MTTFDPDQALAAYIELHDKQSRSQLTSVLISSGVWSAGMMIVWLMLTLPFVNWNEKQNATAITSLLSEISVR